MLDLVTSTLRLTQMAMFVALALAIQLLPTPQVFGGVLRFNAFPLILSGFLLGPRAGFWVGVVTDVLECMLFPKGMFFPGFTLTSGLTAALPALIAGKGPPRFWRYLLGVAVGQGVTKLFLVPLFRALVASPDEGLLVFWAATAGRYMIAQAVHIPLYAWVCVQVVRGVRIARVARPAA